MPFTLEINTAELERLIGGDTEVHVNIRRNIAEEFAKKSLKTFLNDHTYQKLQAEWQELWKDEIRVQIEQFVQDKAAMHRANPIRSDAYGAKDALEKLINAVLPNLVNKTLESYAPTMERLVRDAVNRLIDVRVKELVNAAISRELDGRVAVDLSARIALLANMEIDRRLRVAAKMTTPAEEPKT